MTEPLFFDPAAVSLDLHVARRRERDKLHALIHQLCAARMSLRDVADIVGCSHEQVRRIYNDRLVLRPLDEWLADDRLGPVQLREQLRGAGRLTVIAGDARNGRSSLLASILDQLTGQRPLAILDASTPARPTELPLPAHRQVRAIGFRYSALRERILGPWLDQHRECPPVVAIDINYLPTRTLPNLLGRGIDVLCTANARDADEAITRIAAVLGAETMASRTGRPALLWVQRAGKRAAPTARLVERQRIAELGAWPQPEQAAERIDAHLSRIEHDPTLNPEIPGRNQRAFDHARMQVSYDASDRAQLGIRYTTEKLRRIEYAEAVRYLAALDAGYVGRHDSPDLDAWLACRADDEQAA